MPYASIADARDAMLGMFKTGWNAQTPPVPPVAYPDMKFTAPDASSAWARITVQHVHGSRQVTLGQPGNRRFRKVGVITVQIFTPPGDGLTLADQLVKIAVDIFEGKSTVDDGVQFLNVRPIEVGLNGSWQHNNVQVDFNYDVIK